MSYYVGGLRRIATVFRDAQGVAIDPAILKFFYTAPSGTEVTLTYGVDPGVVKTAQGSYHVDLSLTTAGPWTYRWVSTGAGQAAQYGEFFVESYLQQPWALVSLEKAKKHLRVDDTVHDDDIATKMTQASAIIMDYLKLSAIPATWTTVPFVVEASVLLVLGELFQKREAADVDLISLGVQSLLARQRGPALA